MIVLQNLEQGSPEWFAARVGIPTASNFSKLITPGLKASTSAEEYLSQLIGEWITGEKYSIPTSYAMQWGIDTEPEARESYEFITDLEVEEVGIVYRDEDRMVSCSPDGIVDLGTRGLEIKCPQPITHTSYVLDDKCPKRYVAQVQGSMWVCGLEKWDFMSYHPDYEPLIVTVEADQKWQAAFEKIIWSFIDRLMETRKDPRAIAMRESRLEREDVS